MKFRATFLWLALLSAFRLGGAPTPSRPKLVVAIVVDQFRYDYLTRFRSAYHAGFARMLEQGAVFTDAHHMHFPTVTAIGHSTFLSGATPSISGIIGNDWYDRESRSVVTSVSDPETKLLGGAAGKTGSSPRRLLVSTLGDEMKMAGIAARTIGISIKDRSAILTVGHTADGAYWFDGETGNWVSSSYYFDSLPEWVKAINAKRPADQYVKSKWIATGPAGALFKTMGEQADASFYNSLEATPYGNELIEAMAERAIEAEKLGKHEGTDLLAVSFSANDYVGHAMGPDSPEVKDISIRTDEILGRLLNDLDSVVGRGKYLCVMTADHGVAPTPEANHERRMPGGRLSGSGLFEAIQTALAKKFGEGKWVVGSSGPVPYLNDDLIREKGLNHADVEREAADAARALPHVFRVYTREQLLSGQVMEDYVSKAVRNGFYRQRSGDLFVIPEAYWFFAGRNDKSGTSHGTPFNYDTHVPVVFMGPGIKAGRYYQQIAVNDIAPTLAALLDVEEPSGSVGRILSEVFE